MFHVSRFVEKGTRETSRGLIKRPNIVSRVASMFLLVLV
jgi:hypothetical protein